MKVIDFKDARCRHCYKCVRNCDVKAILVRNEQANIMEDHCIHCGHCLEVCPQNAKTFSSDKSRIQGFLRQGKKVVISIAPSYLGVLEFDRPGQVVAGLKKLGFYEVRETAEGAALVTREYRKLMEENQMKNIITTCCPSVNDLIEKYYPELTSIMAPVISPMIAHGRLIKKLYGEETKVVFLGPCIAKKEEAMGDRRVEGAIDGILTFSELLSWWEEEQIHVKDCQEEPMGNPDPKINQLYPISGGVIASVLAGTEDDHYYKVHIDGLKNCMELLEELKKGEIEKGFFELNVCEGGCVKGPASEKWNQSVIMAKRKIDGLVSHREDAKEIQGLGIDMKKTFYDRRIKDPYPTEAQMEMILHKMGKYTSGDELNCGACGYPTCREKAVAIFQEKAEVSMCLPYAVAKAESMSNIVMDAAPTMILIVDRELRIRECNKKAQELLGVSREEALERYIFEFVEEEDIVTMFETEHGMLHKKKKLEGLKLVVDETMIYMKNLDSVLMMCLDITKEEEAKEKRFQLKMETVEMAQNVINKQMMIAQEIAGLLGETTAETKVTLTKLRDSMLDQEE